MKNNSLAKKSLSVLLSLLMLLSVFGVAAYAAPAGYAELPQYADEAAAKAALPSGALWFNSSDAEAAAFLNTLCSNAKIYFKDDESKQLCVEGTTAENEPFSQEYTLGEYDAPEFALFAAIYSVDNKYQWDMMAAAGYKPLLADPEKLPSYSGRIYPNLDAISADVEEAYGIIAKHTEGFQSTRTDYTEYAYTAATIFSYETFFEGQKPGYITFRRDDDWGDPPAYYVYFFATDEEAQNSGIGDCHYLLTTPEIQAIRAKYGNPEKLIFNEPHEKFAYIYHDGGVYANGESYHAEWDDWSNLVNLTNADDVATLKAAMRFAENPNEPQEVPGGIFSNFNPILWLINLWNRIVSFFARIFGIEIQG